MTLSEEEAKSIGIKAGETVSVLSECKTQAGFMLELMDEIRENELGIAGTIVSPKKAKEEMLFRIDSEINTIKEVYPDIPVRAIILNELGEIRGKVANSDKKNPESAIRQAAEAYSSLHEKLFDTMLEDFAECQCGGGKSELPPATIDLLAKTEGNPISKFCCRQCGECAPAELLEESRFPDRIAWLRHHYKEKHPGIWGKT